MEYFPGSPFESRRSSDEEGSTESSKKKKKKTTRIPLPLQKPEVPEAAAEQDEPKPKLGGFETLFTRKEDKEEPDESKENAEDEDSAEPINATLEIAELTDTETPPEAEFGGTDVPIFTRAEAAEPGVVPETASDTGYAQEAATEPLEAAEGPISTPAASEPAETGALPPEFPPSLVEAAEPALDTEAPAPEVAEEAEEVIQTAVDYEPMTSEPGTPDRHRMIDPSERYGETVAATHHRAETMNPATQEDVNEAYYRGKKRGVSQGVAAGGLAGWWLGRRGKREALRKEREESRRELHKRDKEISQLQAEQMVATERLSTIKRTQEHLAAASTADPEARVLQVEAVPAARATPERPVQVNRSAEQQPKRKPELSPEEQPVAEETYQQPAPGRRVEASSWHSYEVDARTGKLVEDPERVYGEAFKREQRQELMRDKPVEQDKAVSVGHAVLMQAQTGHSAQTAAVSTDQTPAKNKRSSVLKAVLADRAYIKQQLVRRTTNPATWVIALIVVALLFIIGVLR